MSKNIYYLIKSIVAIFGRKNVQKLLIILLVAFLLFLFLQNKGYCATTEITDPYNESIEKYESIINDFIIRMSSVPDTYNTQKETINKLLSGGAYGCYLFYGGSNNSKNGTGMLDINNTILTNDLYLYFYKKDSSSLSASTYTYYLQMPVYIATITSSDTYLFNLYRGYGVDYSIIQQSNNNNVTVHLPSIFYNYRSDSLTNFIQQTNSNTSIIGALNEQTQKIEEQTQKIEEQTQVEQATQDFLKDDSIQSDSVNVDTSSVDSISSSEVQGFFTTLFENFNDTISSDMVKVTIPIPYTDKSIEIPSNLVSSRLPASLLLLVYGFWYYLFGLYGFKFLSHLIKSIKSGDILNGFSFQNEVITSEMM